MLAAMFGNSFGSGQSGFGQAGESDDDMSNVVELRPGPGGSRGGGEGPAGGPSPQQMAPPQAVIAELDGALQHARLAQHRLLDVPLGTIPPDQVSALTTTFNTIQGNVADVVQRVGQAQSNEQLLAVNRDAEQVVQQVQQFVEAVEGTLTEHGMVSADTRPVAAMPERGRQPIDPRRLALIGAAVVGVGIVGVAAWQLNREKKEAAKEARRRSR